MCAGRFCHCCGPETSKTCPYLRVSFASATLAELSEGMARLGAVLRRFAAPAGSSAQTGAPTSSAASSPEQVPASVFASSGTGAQQAGRAAAGGIRALDSAFELGGGSEATAAGKKGAAQQGSARSPTLCLSREGPAEVMPDCCAKVELLNASAAVSEDALAPLPAKTVAGVPSHHLGA